MSTHKNLKLVATIAALAIFGFAAGSLSNQSVSAQVANSNLRPPFNFQKTTDLLAPADIGLPHAGSTVIFTETFGASFAPSTSLGQSTGWYVVTNTGASNYYWGGVSSGVFRPSAWPAAAQITPGPLVTYPANLDTWLVYGPLDLSKFASAYMSFDYYLDSTPGGCYPTYSGDCLTWAYSYDGQTFFGSDTSGHLSPASGWFSGSLILDNKLFRTNSVYIAFAFKGGASPSGTGAFIRNLVLKGNPLKYVYLPLVAQKYTPPPPPPLYGYFFDDSGADLAHWGGAYYGNDNGVKFGQCVSAQCAISVRGPVPHGNPGDSLRLYTNGTYRMVASSPNNIAPDNFDLYMDISPVVIYPRWGGCAPFCDPNDIGDWYGIIFNASDATFGSNPSNFAYNETYYRLYFYNIDATSPIGINLDRCDGGADAGHNSCTTLANSSIPSNFIGNSGGFDTIHIKRLASDGTIEVQVDGQTLMIVHNSKFVGSAHGKFGAFIWSSSNNATQNPMTGYQMQVDFDNIKVYSH